MRGKYVIFGAGKWGREAIKKYGKENILYIVDNKIELQGEFIENLPVVNFEYYLKDARRPQIIVAVLNAEGICDQLEKCKIDNYFIYVPNFEYYFPPDVLIYNTYEYREECCSESDYAEVSESRKRFKWIEKRVLQLNENMPLFQHIEIETYNRCNGVCEFCPVSVQNESRPEKKMDVDLFKKIVHELATLNYGGRLALFSNNEPFLDERILELHRYAREKLPNARMHLYTNGTLLTLDKFICVMQYLDELIIDNYNQELKLISNCREIKGYCENHPELKKRVTIVLRKPQEILATRGGDAPNRKEKIIYENTKCINPFTQMIVRPDGKVSLCCNDPLGRNTMGNLMHETLKEIWYGKKFKEARAALVKGRQFLSQCKYCDVFNLD